jgi:hypothetical protein
VASITTVLMGLFLILSLNLGGVTVAFETDVYYALGGILMSGNGGDRYFLLALFPS